MDKELTQECNNEFEIELLEVFQSAFVPNDNRPIYEWAGEHVTLNSGYAIKGNFDCSISPHFKKVFNAFQNPYVREVNILAPPRSGKTLIAEISLLHTIANNSGDILWLQLSDEKASQMSDLRMIPLLKSCQPVSNLIDLNNKYNITESRYKFLHSTVHITSPKPNALNAVGYKIIFGDEVWKYNGATIIKEIKRRADDYRGVSKCMFFSQGGTKGGAWHEQYNSGEVYEYGWTCPYCKELQRFVFSGTREDKTKFGIVWPTIKEGGNYKIKECASKAVLECEHCRKTISDTPINRKNLLDNGDYIRINSNDCDSTVKSFRFTNFVNVQITFADLVTRFLKAKQKQIFFGSTEDLEQFITKDMADFWDEYVKKERTEIRLADYNTETPFGEEPTFKFLTIDVQDTAPFYYYVCRAWNKKGESRLIQFGAANTWKEIEAIQHKNKIEPWLVFIDSGNKPHAIEAECIKHGRYGTNDGVESWFCWNTMKGSGLRGFKHVDNKFYGYKEGEEITATNEEDAGKSVMRFVFSSYKMSQILESLRDGKGMLWEASDVTTEYTNHLNAVVLMRKIKGNVGELEYVDKPNTPNHYWDCEKMQVAAADIFQCLEATTQDITETNSQESN